ncbi:type II toxin-antitoxin system RelE/ParE family toxin [Gardnerella vaginalis]|uniref:type II toxin-antitoxin system RelE/ParE family toxin n=1 Tax=Gardnerella TaxID=2701 RepID=UPI002155ACBD|nr:type II toxin-antitoxin system RelE/ParE family toxin [Gardnerella vaginalis]
MLRFKQAVALERVSLVDMFDDIYTNDYAIYNIKSWGCRELFDVIFYTDEDGDKPVREFIKSLDVKLRAKVVSDLHRLEMLGSDAREPLSKHVGNHIFELRTILGSNIVRILYFFDANKIIVATNGFVKKQQKTPRSEILVAMQRRAEYFNRKIGL